MGLEAEIKSAALRNGACMVAITTAAPFDGWQRDMRDAVSAGLLPDACIGKVRSDPSAFLAGAKSIIVFGVKYEGLADPNEMTLPRLGCGVRRRPLCRRVGNALEEQVGSLGGLSVANADIPNKRAAERAGLGWLGRNGLFTSADFGSGIRLSTVITDLELAPDEAEPQLGCGKCSRCVESCPGSALAADGRFDATRCLCYLTEYDVPLPLGVRETLGNRLIDCEECQRSCPLNKDLPSVGWPGPDMLELAEQAAVDFPAVSDWFADRFDFRLSNRELLLRTLAVDLANAGLTEAMPLLEILSGEGHAILAECAGWALEKLRAV